MILPLYILQEGVRGRNSDNSLIMEKLGWAPKTKLADGLKVTYDWINSKIEEEKAQGIDVATAYSTSKVVATSAPKELGSLRKGDTQD